MECKSISSQCRWYCALTCPAPLIGNFLLDSLPPSSHFPHALLASTAVTKGSYFWAMQNIHFFVSVCLVLFVWVFLFVYFFLWKATSGSLPQCAYCPSAFHLPLPGIHPATDTQQLQHLFSGFTGSNFTGHEFSQYCLLDWSIKELQSLSVCVAQAATPFITASGGKGKQLHKLQHICFARPPCSHCSQASFRTPCSNRNRDDILRVKWAEFLGNRWC